MIHLITGVPGAGKTLRAVYHIKREIEKGRLVYANIDGLNIKGVQPAPRDWTTTPEGSLVVYDEAQQIFPPDGKVGRSNRPDIAQMEVHRHTGHDLILITQHPNLIHSHVRRLVGKHEHLTRAFGWNQAMIYLKDQAIKVDSKTELKSCEQKLWKHDKSLFDLYQSASLHVEHKRLPKPLIYLVATVLLLVLGFLALWGSVDFTNLGGKAMEQALRVHEVQPVQAATAKPQYWAETALVLGGCIWDEQHCMCYDENLRPVDMTAGECRAQVERPLPMDLRAIPSTQPPAGGATSGAPPAGGGIEG